MLLWRISNYETLDGTGGMLAPGRWHSKGYLVVYCATDPSTALLEVLVHTGEFEADSIPITYKYLKIHAPDDISADKISLTDLPADWKDNLTITRRIGAQWLASVRTALLNVPSVLVPETRNVLLNPKHPEKERLRILSVIPYSLDSRLR